MKEMASLKGIYEKIFEQARPFLQTRNNLLHTQIALRFAKKLLKTEGGDEGVVIPAILLHDVGWKVIPEPLQLKAFGPHLSDRRLTKVHEREGVKIAKAILKGVNYPPEKIREICRIIRGHDSGRRTLSLNDSIVKDADKLWRYSPKGVAVDAGRFQIPKKELVAYLMEKIDRWFFTDSAREIARREIERQIPLRTSFQGEPFRVRRTLRAR